MLPRTATRRCVRSNGSACAPTCANSQLVQEPHKLDYRRSSCGIGIARLRLLGLRSSIARLRVSATTTGFPSFHFAAENRAVFNGETLGANFAGYAASIPQLHTLRAVNFSVDMAANNDFARGNVRFNL